MHGPIEQGLFRLFRQDPVVVERVIAFDQHLGRRADVLAVFVDDAVGKLILEAELAHRAVAVEGQNGLAAALRVGLQDRLGVFAPLDDAGIGAGPQVTAQFGAERIVVGQINEQ